MKTHLFQTSILLIIICQLYGCIDTDSKQRFYQFSSDDLSYLYFDKDTLNYSGKRIYYCDTISFLRNSMDTLQVEVNTSISDYSLPMSFANSLEGRSIMYFDKHTGFEWANVKIFKDVVNTDKYIGVKMLEGGCTDIKLVIPVDTANVLGKTYNDVYKFEYPNNSPTLLKRIYFAKNFGFIKIETANGRTLELINTDQNTLNTIKLLDSRY